MNKRNTEGYVLIYVLVAVTVMGLLAATLMTSTLQVVQAQEKSLAYMKEKYEVQGEVEKLFAELDSVQYEYTPASGAEAFYTMDPDVCIADAKNYLSSVLIPALSSKFPAMTINHSIEDTLTSWTLSISAKSSVETAKVVAELSFHPGIQTESKTVTRTEDILDPETSEVIGTQEISEQWYTYSIDVKDVKFSSYQITSNGGGT